MTVLIPSYEPTQKLITLIDALKAQTDYPILIVDDGSGSAYADLFAEAKERGCILLTHEHNKGKGAALKTGFAYLIDHHPNEAVVCADSDGQHSVTDIIRVAEAIKHDRMTMILGVREFKGNVPFKSRYGNAITAFFFKLTTGITLNDTQTGLRGYPHIMLSWLMTIEGDRFEYELNQLLESKHYDIALEQLTIATIYEGGNKGSHFKPVRDSIRVLFPIIKFCGSSLASALLDLALLFVFQSITGSLFWGVVLARTVSSVFNYLINKYLVFHAKKAQRSAIRYFGLVIVIMLLNYALIYLMTVFLHVPDLLAKLLAELILLLMSYSVQSLFVFAKRNHRSV